MAFALAAMASSALAAPEHPYLAGLSQSGFGFACGAATDSEGDVYVADYNGTVSVYGPTGDPITTISGLSEPCGLAVDSAGNLYVNRWHSETTKLVPSGGEYPPTSSTTYSPDTSVNGTGVISAGPGYAVAVDPATDNVYVSEGGHITEYEPDGTVVDATIGSGVAGAQYWGVDVYGANGDIYANDGTTNEIYVFDSSDLAGPPIVTIDGSETPDGSMSFGSNGAQLAVDQANGHVYVFDVSHLVVDEFEASGPYVSQLSHSFSDSEPNDVAVGLPGSPIAGDVFVAAVDQLAAFGPLTYGTAPPVVVTQPATGKSTSGATLNGTVNPEGNELTSCMFEWGETSSYGETTPCDQNPAEIGSELSPQAVSVDLAGLPSSRFFHFRLVATNAGGTEAGGDFTFSTGPAVSATAINDIGSDAATAEAQINPNGEATSYVFQYVTQAQFEAGGFANATSVPASAGAIGAGTDVVTVSRVLSGLSPSTSYRVRAVASNAAGTVNGPDRAFTTFAVEQPGLPDGRAYELVTPSETNGRFIGTLREGDSFETPAVAQDGNSVIFNTSGVLPGMEGNGFTDAYQSIRTSTGWITRPVEPSGAQAVNPFQGGTSEDHGYSFWTVEHGGSLDIASPESHWLRKPDGSFELIGIGSEGVDPDATGDWVAADGAHIIFSTRTGISKKLEPNAPDDGVAAIYDRSPGGATHVVSLLPGNAIPTTDAHFLRASRDGSAVVFTVGGNLYVRSDNTKTALVAPINANYAGISADGGRVFYEEGDSIFAFEVATETQVPIAGGEAEIVNVSADGSDVYYAKPSASPGTRDLFDWNGTSSTFVAALDERDFEEFGGQPLISLSQWSRVVGPVQQPLSGWANDPSRTTPDGSILVFQSHGVAGYPFDSNGFSEIYRYDSIADALTCVSCRSGGGAPSTEAELQSFGATVLNAPVDATTRIQNISDDGATVVFQSREPLVLRDVDGKNDVYEWKAGRVSLISSGSSAGDDYLVGMSGDASNIVFKTSDALVPQDLTGGSGSLYDARIGGGFPRSAPAPGPCGESSCQGNGSTPPALPPAPGSTSVEPTGHAKPKHKHRRHKKQRKHRRHRHHKGKKSKKGSGGHAHRRASDNSRGTK